MEESLYHTTEGCATEVTAQVFCKCIYKICKLSAFRMICASCALQLSMFSIRQGGLVQ